MDINKLTSFASIITGEGYRIAYTYSVIESETGLIKSNNNKGSFVVLDESLKSHIDSINSYINENKL